MKSKRFIYLFCLVLGIAIGFMVGVSSDPVDRAIRKAQKINKTNLSGISSLRQGGSWNLFGIFSKPKSIQEQIQTDVQFSNQYVQRIQNNIAQKEKAIATLEEAKEFIDLATQEVFIENSLQKYLYSLGRIQLENGMVFQAITNLKRSYEITPYEDSTAQLLAQAYLALYQVLPDSSEKYQAGDEAIRFLKLTLMTNPNNISMIYGLALIYTDQGLYTSALPLFLKILERQPENIDALLGVGRIYYDQGSLDKARRIYEQTEALILELKNKNTFLRKNINPGVWDQKLDVIRRNLEVIYKSQESTL